MGKVHIDKNIITYEEDDEIILVNVMINKFFGLDKMGTYFFKELVQQQSVSKMIDSIYHQFDVPYDVVCKDVQTFINELKKMGVTVVE